MIVVNMSYLTYTVGGETLDRELVWLHGELRTPPLSQAGRIEAGILLRRLQSGESLSLPQSRPMPSIGARCHELRISADNAAWRIVYRTDSDAIVIVAVFQKTTRATPSGVIDACRRRLRSYDSTNESEG